MSTLANEKLKATFTGTLEDWRMFTKTEWKILLLYCEGMAKKTMADYLNREENTIATHQTKIRQKAGTHTMAQAAFKVIAKNIVNISTLCIMVMVSSHSYFIPESKLMDTRRAPRTVRVTRTRSSFRDYLV